MDTMSVDVQKEYSERRQVRTTTNKVIGIRCRLRNTSSHRTTLSAVQCTSELVAR